MATAGGPNIEKNGLVFGFDTGRNPSSDFNHKNKKRRFFKGEPSTNLWDSIDNTQSLRGNRTQHYWDGKRWTIDGSYTDPGVPGPKNIYLGKVFKFTSGALNSVWSGNSHGYMLRDIATTSGQTYTMSAWVYVSIDCDVDSIPAVIEGEAGGESTVSGFPASYNLSNKGTWQRTAKKALADGNVRFIPTYTKKIGVTDGSFSGFFMWASPQVVLGDRPRPYIQTGTSRSSTQSLIDLTKTTNIDVSNVSFNSDGQPTFDGTDDYIDVTSMSSFSLKNITILAKPFENITPSYLGYYPQWMEQLNSFYIAQGPWTGGATDETFHIWNKTDSTMTHIRDNISNDWHQFVWNWNGTTYDCYIDGIQKTTYPRSNGHAGLITINTSTLRLGANFGTYFYKGDMATIKMYNRALTSQEIKQNFKAYKNRFNI